jgi:hypothetical protein
MAGKEALSNGERRVIQVVEQTILPYGQGRKNQEKFCPVDDSHHNPCTWRNDILVSTQHIDSGQVLVEHPQVRRE